MCRLISVEPTRHTPFSPGCLTQHLSTRPGQQLEGGGYRAREEQLSDARNERSEDTTRDRRGSESIHLGDRQRGHQRWTVAGRLLRFVDAESCSW